MKLLDPGTARRAVGVAGVVAGVVATMAGALMVFRSSPAAAADAEAPQPPEPAPEKVTLGEAVTRALGRNPTVAVALSEIDRADALIKKRAPAGIRR